VRTGPRRAARADARTTGTRTAAVAAVAVATLLLAGCTGTTDTPDHDATAGRTSTSSSTTGRGGAWSYRDATGSTVRLDHRPERIVALDDLAVSLLHYRVRPVGVFGQESMAADPRFADVDTSGITQLGSTAGTIDLDRLAALHPDLVVTSVYPTDTEGTIEEGRPASGFASLAQQRAVAAIAPVVQVAWTGTGVDAVDRVTTLAESLGAEQRVVDAAQDRFDAARERLRAVADRSDVRVVSLYADADGVYVTRPSDEPTLQLLEDTGVDVVTPGPAGYYWGVYSWPKAGNVAGDVVLLSQRGWQVAEIEERPTLADSPAFEAGQVRDWPAPALDLVSQATAMTDLAGWLEDSRRVS
jgi:iron complex transport system substrate-binding protein